MTDEQFLSAKPLAERKLNWIIGREGDANGERRKPYYLAKLIEEQTRADALTEFCQQHYTLMKAIVEWQTEAVRTGTKKEMPVENPQSTSQPCSYCITPNTICHEIQYVQNVCRQIQDPCRRD
jgi:hypothetical protein